jgi:RNA polymerase sigma-70 factor (ECF subfamily)
VDDPHAFGSLFDRYVLQIYRFVHARVRDQRAAETLTSEVFTRALKGMGRYRETEMPFSAWLYQIAVNAVADHYRRERPAAENP